MNEKECRRILRSLPSGLTFSEVAARTGLDYQKARIVIAGARYRAVDGRKFGQRNRRKLAPEHIDWKQANVDIAREFGVSRERVRVLREQLGKAPVEARGRKFGGI